jgi:hypothetical protein
MRFTTLAAAMCLSLLPIGGGFAAAPPAEPPASSASAAAKSTPAAPAAPTSSQAAAKHAKRTICLKDAKTQKLVGAEKTSFLRNCMGAP